MSLAHNGHNQFSDSNTGEFDNTAKHNGISALGKQLIEKMNYYGIMVDISHPSKQAIKQTIAHSKAPIIASHSSARALSDHPRNLDDEQLQWVKESGGVVQTVALAAFVNKEKDKAFKKAKDSSPAIIFIDEIDAVGRMRGAGLGGGHDEREQTLNQLLVEMDGFESNQGVILMAATNRPNVLDPALLRPRRFDKQVIVDRPDLEGRTQILKVHSKDKPLAKNIDLKTIAKQTPGFTGADLANLLNESALLAARKDKKTISNLDIENSIDRVLAGPEKKSRLMSDDEKLIIAYHETGHALVGWALPNADPIHKVTIIPRGRALGYTQALPDSEKYLSSKAELKDRLAMLMGGRVAEELIFKDPTTGASNDIEKATDIARKMVMEFGMSEKLGPMLFGKGSNEVFLGRDYGRQQDYSDEVASAIDEEVKVLLNDAHAIAGKILRKFKKQMDSMVEVLMDKETIDKEEVSRIFKSIKKVKIQGSGKTLKLA